MKREWKKPEPKKEIAVDMFGNIIPEEENPIDLSFILNLLDGTLESEGRILAITTNFPERIDRALIRPGRIDMIVHFKKCSIKTLREMVEGFHDFKLHDSTLIDPSLEEKWSPAEVNQILFRNFKDHLKALDELLTLKPEDLSGFN
jgi:SpoVK/Ycf46/Vps4 family AAA+-type ATPase